MKILINNEEVLCSNQIEIKEEMLNTSSTILKNCYPKSWELNKEYTEHFYYPKDYSLCKIYDNEELIFCGVVKNTGNINLSPYKPRFCDLQVLDFKTFLSEGETLDFVINNKTIVEAIQLVINAIKDYGVELGEIQILNPNDIINAYSTLNKSAYDVLQYIANITQSRWKTRLVDEETIAVDFYDPTLMQRASDIKYTQEYFEENEIIDMNYNYSTRDYRNKQVMLSNQIYGNIEFNETIIADGFNKTFMTQNNIGEIKKITINGVEVSFTTNNNKELGIEADFYYTVGTNIFESNSDNAPYIANTIINISYIPLINGREVILNSNEINRITEQTNRKGTIARYENRNDVLSSDELLKIGQSYIKYKGSPEITLKIETTKNLFEVGQIVLFDAPIDELKTDYMIKSKTIKIINSIDKIFYTFELTSSFNSENAINYFDNQRNKANGNIAEGEFITRNIDIENQANIIFQNINSVEKEIIGDNILNCGLDAPLIK